MVKILGDFIETFPPECNSLELSFSSTLSAFAAFGSATSNRAACDSRQWRNNLLSANFIAEYCTNFLPQTHSDPKSSIASDKQRTQDVKGAIGYIANELLENALKFNLDSTGLNARSNVKLGVHFTREPEPVAVVFASNSLDKSSAESFQQFIHRLLGGDAKELYFQKIEANTAAADSPTSGLGFLTMMNDYQARLGWRFESVCQRADTYAHSCANRGANDPLHDVVIVTSMAQIVV